MSNISFIEYHIVHLGIIWYPELNLGLCASQEGTVLLSCTPRSIYLDFIDVLRLLFGIYEVHRMILP